MRVVPVGRQRRRAARHTQLRRHLDPVADWDANAAGDVPEPRPSSCPGQFVKVELLDLKREGAILVPQRAVQQGLTGAYVYVVGDSNKVGIRPVQASSWFGSQWMLDAGINAGDKVIVDGTQKIFPGRQGQSGGVQRRKLIRRSGRLHQDVPAAPAFPLASGRR